MTGVVLIGCSVDLTSMARQRVMAVVIASRYPLMVSWSPLVHLVTARLLAMCGYTDGMVVTGSSVV